MAQAAGRTQSSAAEELSRIAGVIVELSQGRSIDAEIRKVRRDVEELGRVYSGIESRLQSGIQEMMRSKKKELNSSSDIGNAICSKICNDIRELSRVRCDIKELEKARVASAGLSKEITGGAEESKALESAARAGTDAIEAHAGELEAPIAKLSKCDGDEQPVLLTDLHSQAKWVFVFGVWQPGGLSNLQSQANLFKGDGEVQHEAPAYSQPKATGASGDGEVQRQPPHEAAFRGDKDGGAGCALPRGQRRPPSEAAFREDEHGGAGGAFPRGQRRPPHEADHCGAKDGREGRESQLCGLRWPPSVAHHCGDKDGRAGCESTRGQRRPPSGAAFRGDEDGRAKRSKLAKCDGDEQPVWLTNLQSQAKCFFVFGEEQPVVLSNSKGDGEEQGVPGTSAALSAATESAPCKRARTLAPEALVPGSGAWPQAASFSREAGLMGSSTFEAAGADYPEQRALEGSDAEP